MPKRKRLFTQTRNKTKIYKLDSPPPDSRSPRGRLMGALLEAFEGDSEATVEASPVKKRCSKKEEREETAEDIARQSYVLKLFDRSVDLSQFTEETPLYPICRAWIANQPKAKYSQFGKDSFPPLEETEKSVELPGPEGPRVPRIPPLLPEQLQASKDNININYKKIPPQNMQELINKHVARWSQVRRAWQHQSAKVEARYSATQRVLNEITKGTIPT